MLGILKAVRKKKVEEDDVLKQQEESEKYEKEKVEKLEKIKEVSELLEQRENELREIDEKNRQDIQHQFRELTDEETQKVLRKRRKLKSYQLHLAIEENNLLEVQQLLEGESEQAVGGRDQEDVTADTVNVNFKHDVDGDTPLIKACKYGRKRIVELLLENNDIDVHRADDLGLNAMMYAAKEGHFQILKMLHAAGCRVFDRDPDGWTSLIYAADSGYWPICEYLLSHNADPTVATRFRETALMKAAINGHEMVCRLLVTNSEVNVNGKNSNGNTALILAAYYGKVETVRCLAGLNKIQIEIKNNAGQTARSILCSHYAVEQWKDPLPRDMKYARLAVSHAINHVINESSRDKMKDMILENIQIDNYRDTMKRQLSAESLGESGAWCSNSVMASEYMKFGDRERVIREYECANFMYKKGLVLAEQAKDEYLEKALRLSIETGNEVKHVFERAFNEARDALFRSQSTIHFNAGMKFKYKHKYMEAVQCIHLAVMKNPSNVLYKEALQQARKDQKDYKHRVYALQEARLRRAQGEPIPASIQAILNDTERLAPKKPVQQPVRLSKKSKKQPLADPPTDSKANTSNRHTGSSAFLCF